MTDSPRRAPARADSAAAFCVISEQLESRTLMHAGHFHAAINFQPSGSGVPSGYVADAGASYGSRNGLTYGWNTSRTGETRDRNSGSSPDQRYDTLIRMSASARWDLAVTDGRYAVRVVAGDPSDWDNSYRINVEGTTAINGAASSAKRWFDNTITVNVTDGRLTVSSGSGAIDNRLAFIEVSEVQASVDDSVAPAAPANFSATRYSSSGITLAWSDASNNEAGFKIERKTGSGGSWQQIATVGAGVTGYDSGGLSANTYYVYRVRAYNAAGNSAYSNEDGSTTLSGSTPAATGTLRWSTVAASPVPRAEGQAGVIGGKLYVLGGVDNVGPYARSDVYDPATNKWTRLRDLPKKLTHAGTAVEGRNIYLAGGYVGTASTGWAQLFATRDVWRYNVDTDTYTAMPQLPEARGGGALVALGRTLHFVAGADLKRADRGEHWMLDLDNLAAGWKGAATMPNGRSHLAAVVLGGKIYIVAGQRGYDNAAVGQTDVHVWNPANPGVWTKAAPLPRRLSHHNSSTVVRNGRILVLGGATTPTTPTSAVSSYDPATNMWTDLSPLPSSRTSGVAGVINGVVYYASGSAQTTTWKGAFS
ncbi:MAG: fibronectin type III domain-containing protein [Planctomycetota bacterium]|nr:fibronectin type III domain-containing protein [Planctomycetota bacterium]